MRCRCGRLSCDAATLADMAKTALRYAGSDRMCDRDLAPGALLRVARLASGECGVCVYGFQPRDNEARCSCGAFNVLPVKTCRLCGAEMNTKEAA